MPALAQCDAFAYIYDQAGDPAPDILVVLKRVLDASGNPILLGPKTTTTDSAGSFHFTLPEFATAFISARASAFWDCKEGRAFKVPLGPSGELVPDFSLPPSTLVEPPLVYVGDVLSIPKASETQDGYLSAADYVAFLAAAGADVGITSITAGTGLTGGTITDTGTISLATIPGVAGTWANPSSITVNAQGQIIAIISGAPDTTAPLVTLGSPTIVGTSVTINWATDEPADSQVDYSADPDTSYGTSTTPDTTPVTDHHVLITSLAPSTLYHYRVKSKDTASPPNAAIPVTSSFMTTAVVDTTAPIITLAIPPVTGITASAATINWTTNELADSQVEYSTDTSYGTPTVPPITNIPPSTVTDHHVALGSLTALQLYHYRVKSKDAAGNPATPVTGTFTTSAPGADPSVGLVSYWKMDETTGTRFDSIVANHNDLLDDIPPNAPSIAGIIGNAADSPYDSSFLRCLDNPSLRFSGSMSIAGWVKVHSFGGVPAGTGQFNTLASKISTSADCNFILWYRSDLSRWEFVVSATGALGGAAITAMIPGALTLGTWYHVAAVYNQALSHITLKINDGAVGSDTQTFGGPIFGSSADLSVLLATAGTPLFGDCAVDELGIWSRALSDAEVTQLYNGGTPPPYPFS